MDYSVAIEGRQVIVRSNGAEMRYTRDELEGELLKVTILQRALQEAYARLTLGEGPAYRIGERTV